MTKSEICHVCKKEKKPYIVLIKNSIFSFFQYEQARNKGPICKRCNSYFAMTGEFKDATKQEFAIAKKSVWFANMMLKWWEKDEKTDPEDYMENTRTWDGTDAIARWCREQLAKSEGGDGDGNK